MDTTIIFPVKVLFNNAFSTALWGSTFLMESFIIVFASLRRSPILTSILAHALCAYQVCCAQAQTCG
jgi:hypothetical protein